MTAALDPTEWLTLIGREYLDAFIPAGGAAIKFAVPLDQATRAATLDGLGGAAERRGLLVAHVDAAVTRVHLADQLFFAIARQIPWRQLAVEMLGRAVAGRGWRMPAEIDGPMVARISELNGIDAELIHADIDRFISREVMREPRMARDFRVAITHLCRAVARGGDEGEVTRETLISWLTGEKSLLAAVRPYHIHTRITRTNARHILVSLLNLLRILERPGLAIVVDIGRLDLSKNPRDGGTFYTRAAVLDAYEVLRQFIDAMDRLSGLFLLVVPGTGFLAEETGGRGVGAYEALKFRIWDDVRDARLANPMAALVRLSAGGGS